MLLSGVGAEQQTQVYQSLLSGSRSVSGVQKVDRGDHDVTVPEKRVQPSAPVVQDQVTLSREAQQLAALENQRTPSGQGTSPNAPSPFER